MAALGNHTASPIQYIQKQMNPCHGPKSPRAHRYMPPDLGYFAVSDATANARGTTKKTAVSSHSVTDPGPACAAAAIQRVPTMQVMAKRVRSRRPSSRFSSDTRRFLAKLEADAAQPFRQELRLAAQPD